MLERDADAKKIVMTLKKALIGSKLPALTHLEVPHILSSYPCSSTFSCCPNGTWLQYQWTRLLQDAIPGSRSHGYVTGITDYGVFVGFYAGLKGLVHAKELDQKPQDCFETGQVRSTPTHAAATLCCHIRNLLSRAP